ARCHKNYREARVLDILEASPDRVPRCCVLASGEPLPGAVYDHLRYGAEVRAKAGQLAEVLNRLRVADPPRVEVEAVASPLELHYRNKSVLHAGPDGARRRLGYWTGDHSRVVDVEACPLSRGEMNAALAGFRAGPAMKSLGRADKVTLRWTAHDGAMCWVNAATGRLTEDGDMAVERDGFWQVNPEVSALLATRVADWHEAGRARAPRVLDLYCGAGLFAVACAKRGAGSVRGVEVSAGAVACARENAARHNVPARFDTADVEQCAAKFLDNGRAAETTVIVDPPRRGLAPRVCGALAASGAPRVIYVSCDPATLGRDLALLLNAGYRVRHAAMFDMFPRTAHFESVVCLEK
ncbi:MAG: methyltransferase domain-containing protein, partial [Kiritimatiellaeota bacterium]|nr:methyltransferase domain-containing protein [Kiritimatiellota bacterium]